MAQELIPHMTSEASNAHISLNMAPKEFYVTNYITSQG